MTKKQKTEIEKAAVAQVPAFIEEGSEGLENMRGNDMLIPRLSLQQALSPHVVEKDCDSGDIINSVTAELIIPEGSKEMFVPIYHYLEWIEWGLRSANEGILNRSLDPEGALAQSVARGEKKTTPEGKEVYKVTEYHNFICILPSCEPIVPMVISCAKTNHRQGKKLLSLARFRGKFPLFSGQYSITSNLQENKRGEKYYVFDFENAGWVENKEMFEECKSIYENVKEAFMQKRLIADQEADTVPVDDEM